MISAALIDQTIRVLLAATPAGSDVILFGSHARGDAHDDSDLDLLVVEPTLDDRRGETVRLRQSLRPLRVSVDVLVVSRAAFDAWKDLPNNVISPAAREGRTYPRAA